MKKIVNPTIVHSATQPSERADLWIKALPNNQNTLMIFDNGYENVDSNLTERLNNEAQERQSSDEELNNKINQETTNRVNADNNLSNRINTNLNSINNINSKIPAQASSTNQLADKNFVNSSIANDAATFQGTFETVNDLPTTNVKKNDYAFIVSVTSEGNPEYKRYKYNGTQWLEEFVLNNSSFTANQWASINSGVTENWINETTETLKSVTGSTIEITWSDLKAKRDAGELTPSQFYRITDYQCTTVQSNTRSAGNQFDIIVLALTNNTLSEQAWAALHSGDTYFANSNLSAWKLWYCLDNDTTRFAWADNTSGNGRGVIYKMIDEFNNDVPYDFKNIQFKHPIDTATYRYYYYTFASENAENNTDYSLSATQKIYSNKILPYIDVHKQFINRILFIGNNCCGNTFGNDCWKNAFGESCFHNTFGDYFKYNIFGNYCRYNIFGNDCTKNILKDSCMCNIFGNHCIFNAIFVECSYNNFGNKCQYIKFSEDSSASSGHNFYRHNHFGDGCQYIVFKGAAGASSAAQVQNYNFAQGLQGTSDAYLTVDGVRNRSYETKVARNSAGELKIYCEADLVQ